MFIETSALRAGLHSGGVTCVELTLPAYSVIADMYFGLNVAGHLTPPV
jgi:hypothetical protein